MASRQIENLTKQKEALQKINKQREYENKLIEARNRLEEAGKEKKRVWREGVGWVYESDQNAISEARKNLEEVENERQVKEIEIMIEGVEALKESIDKLKSDEEFAALEAAAKAVLGEESEESGLSGLISVTKKLYTGEDSVTSLLEDGVIKNLESIEGLFNRLVSSDLADNDKYKNATTKELIDWAEGTDQTAKYGAFAELQNRGYTQNTNGTYSYATKEKGATEKDIQEAIFAYSSGNLDEDSKEKVATFLNENGYELNGTTWKKKKDSVEIKNLGNYWVSPYPYTGKDTNYLNMQKDFETDAITVYKKKDGVFVKDRDIKAIDYGNFDEFLRQHNGYIIDAWAGNHEWGLITSTGVHALQKAASGALALPGGPTLLNENGTEAIVTPYGTVTSLPSGTGVVPADITKNLWALGEVAPAISRLLEPMVKKDGAAVLGDNFSVQNMVVNMNPDGSFDVDGFITELKSAIALRRNS